MKLIITFALFLALAGFICGQLPPVPYLACSVPTSTQTSGLFCASGLTYAVLNTTNFATVDTSAKSSYTAALANVQGTPSQACKDALATFYCQVGFPRCTGALQYASILNTRCSAVNAACATTNFPSTPFTGPQCVANSFLTVDGTPATCFPSSTVTLGAACQSYSQLFAPTFNFPNTSTVAVVNCPLVSTCNGTTTASCVAPNKLGDACTTTCVTGSAQPGVQLACIAGTCQYANKLHGYKCLANAECASNNCTAGACYNQPLGGTCNSPAQCRANLYCDTFNSTCYSVALAGEPCGVTQVSATAVPCAFGFTCVRGASANVTARCQSNAVIGGACSVPSGAAVYDAPLCDVLTLPANGDARCVNSVCTNVQPATQGQFCDATTKCAVSLTCAYSNATAGTCQDPTTVPCDTIASPCNDFQTCNCKNGLTNKGTCQIDSTNPVAQCVSQNKALLQCQITKCQDRQSRFFPYDTYSCGATQCLNEVNAYFCCLKNAVGTNYVAPAGSPADPCATPSPTPGPTTTRGPTATPVPIQSSKRSGAATVAVSFVAMIVAVVAFCL